MKALNKITSLTATVAMVASCATLSVSAKAVNNYSVSYETLTKSIISETGDYIPAGSTAVTMSIDNNSGFNNGTFLLNITDGYDVITGDDDRPVIDLGNNMSGFLSAASAYNGKLCVSVASTETCRSEGGLFTFYCTSDGSSDNIPATVNEMNSSFSRVSVNDNSSMPRTDWHRIYFGNVDGDEENKVNSVDAYYVLAAINNAGGDCYIPSFVYHYPWLLSTYFPSVYLDNPYCYICADVLNNPNGLRYVDDDDAQEILYYAACQGTGVEYSGIGWFGYCWFDIDSLA